MKIAPWVLILMLLFPVIVAASGFLDGTVRNSQMFLSLLLFVAVPWLAICLLILAISFFIKTQFEKTTFSSYGIEYKNKKASWNEITSIDVTFVNSNSEKKKSNHVFLVASNNDQIQINFTFINSVWEVNYLRKKFKEHCPRHDLIQRADEILNKDYMKRVKTKIS